MNLRHSITSAWIRHASTASVAALALTCLVLSGCDVESGDDLAGVEVPAAGDVAPAADTAAEIEAPSDAVATVPAVPIVPGTPPETPSPAPAKLTIGDPAPELQLASYVTGDPVETKLGGGVHVVEFWATWCGPCRVGMPHISELQDKYGDDVKFVGVTREDAATVEGFLEQEAPDGRLWSEVITYRLAIDSDDATNNAYMRAAGQSGIPTAFIVGSEGLVEWIGHPARIDQPLQQVVDGTWDRSAAIAEMKQQERMRQLSNNLRQWTASGQWDQALDALAEVEKEVGSSVGLMQSRLAILERAGREEEAAPLRNEIVEKAWDDAQMLNMIAWGIASSSEPTDLELAKKAAERASELRDHEDAAVLDTVARVYYEMGQLDKAIEWQRKAVEQNGGQYRQIDQALEKYLGEQEASEEKSDS